MYIGSETIAEFGNKRGNKFTLDYRYKGLIDVRASASAPFPTTVFRGEIAIYQLLHEMRKLERVGL